MLAARTGRQTPFALPGSSCMRTGTRGATAFSACVGRLFTDKVLYEDTHGTALPLVLGCLHLQPLSLERLKCQGVLCCTDWWRGNAAVYSCVPGSVL